MPFKCTFPFVRRARESVRLRCKCRASNGRPRPAFPDTPIMPRCELTRQGEWAMARHKGKVPTGQAAYRSIPRSFDLSYPPIYFPSKKKKKKKRVTDDTNFVNRQKRERTRRVSKISGSHFFFFFSRRRKSGTARLGLACGDFWRSGVLSD